MSDCPPWRGCHSPDPAWIAACVCACMPVQGRPVGPRRSLHDQYALADSGTVGVREVAAGEQPAPALHGLRREAHRLVGASARRYAVSVR